jgi:L,D-transpeptidase catalytic domain
MPPAPVRREAVPPPTTRPSETAPVGSSVSAPTASAPTASAPTTTPAANATAAEPPQATLTARVGEHRILAEPRHGSAVIGVFRAGQSLPLRAPEPYRGPDAERCEPGWAEVAPRGWVCPNARMTRDPQHPDAVAAREVLPREAPAPFLYGRALGSPRYRRIPTIEERRRYERAPAKPAAPAQSEALPVASEPLVTYLAERAGELRHTTGAYGGMKLAFAKRFDRDGERWLITPALLLVPASSVELDTIPAPRPVVIDSNHALPFARVITPTPTFVRDGPRWRERERLEPGTELALTDPPLSWRGGRSVANLADGALVPDAAVSVFRRHAPPPQLAPGDKWVHVSVMQGALIAYQGTEPKFGAVISPGMHGVTPNAEFRTPPGTYRVSAKWLTSDMGGSLGQGSWRTRAVPWVAYYDGSFALHGAWWHDAFGRPRSHGCINLTPADAQGLFAWLEPAIPDGWYAVRADAKLRPGTLVLVTP